MTARTWVAATVVLALLLVLASWFLLIGPVRADAAAVRSDVADTQARNQQTVARTEELKRQFANLPDEQAELDELELALPEDVDLPGLITAIDGFADQTGVTIMSIGPGAAAPVVDPAAAAAAPAPAPTESAAPTDGSPAAPVAPPAPTGPVTIAIPITTTVIGNFFEAEAFLRQLQTKMPRAYLVRDLSVTAEKQQEAASGRPSTTPGDVTMTITADVFSRPTPTAATPAPGTPPATGTVPAPGTAPAPGTTVAPSAPATGTPAPGPALPSQDPAAAT